MSTPIQITREPTKIMTLVVTGRPYISYEAPPGQGRDGPKAPPAREQEAPDDQSAELDEALACIENVGTQVASGVILFRPR